jgi:hypothetical protein
LKDVAKDVEAVADVLQIGAFTAVSNPTIFDMFLYTIVGWTVSMYISGPDIVVPMLF